MALSGQLPGATVIAMVMVRSARGTYLSSEDTVPDSRLPSESDTATATIYPYRPSNHNIVAVSVPSLLICDDSVTYRLT